MTGPHTGAAHSRPGHLPTDTTPQMKALLTLTLAVAAFALSSCTSDGRCIFAGKKKEACPTGSCCAKKAATDCKTCKH
jgi:hypothetical protein